MEESTSNQPWFVPTPYQQTIEMADGTVLNGSASPDGDGMNLWIWLDRGTSLSEAYTIFSDTAKTVTITCHLSNIDTRYWSGYIRVAMIREDNGKVTIRMQR